MLQKKLSLYSLILFKSKIYVFTLKFIHTTQLYHIKLLSIKKGHRLKDFYGRVVCPVLRSYVCPICNASGDSAHTIKYCPMGNKDESYKFKLHETPRTSSGLRKNTKWIPASANYLDIINAYYNHSTHCYISLC